MASSEVAAKKLKRLKIFHPLLEGSSRHSLATAEESRVEDSSFPAPFRGYFRFPPWSPSYRLLFMTPIGTIAPTPAALRREFIRELCHSPKNTELTRSPGLENRSALESIGVNRSESE
jgi:hypothetical protein